MARLPLLGCAYAGRSLIASAQEAINLYAESNKADPETPTPITYYQTPGSELYSNSNVARPTRMTYRTSSGTAYVVIGTNVYFLDVNQVLSLVGFIADRTSQVYAADNGLVCILTDGASGYVIDMDTNDFAQIIDPNFYPADFVVFLDTFFVFNRAGTNQFFITASMADFGMLTNTAISTGTISNAGTLYTGGTYSNVPLTGGTGSGATAEITVTQGQLATGNITTPGATYTNNTYINVPLTTLTGAGTGARATITVAGAVVTSVVVTTVGSGYLAGNTLSADASTIGGTGTGFVYTIATVLSSITEVDLDQPGQGYLIGDILSADPATIGGTGTGFTWTVATTASAFDPLDIAAKSGSADPIVGMTTTHQELWLIGALTTEVWIGSGAADFFFQQQQGAYIDHGCAAQYSISNTDILSFWIAEDKQGNGLVLQGANYEVKEISTPRIVAIIKQGIFSDAIGFCFQISDHAFYVIVLPSQNLTLMYDLTTEMWNKWAWTDGDGNLNRHRANCAMFAYGKNIIGDWETGKLLALDDQLYQDEGQPIVRIRTLPHIVNGEYSRISGKSFDADISVGNGQPNEDEPMISLSWSDDRGKSYGNPVQQSMGKEGEYLTTVSWNRLGQARDRVYKLQWSANVDCALNGAFIDSVNAKS